MKQVGEMRCPAFSCDPDDIAFCWISGTDTHRILGGVPQPSPSCIQIIPKAGQEQGRYFEEVVAHTHQISWSVPPSPWGTTK